jgi:chromosomal replication initiation ATPase DnaA
LPSWSVFCNRTENQTIWNKTIEQLKEVQPLEDVEARLAGTTLIKVTDTAARIFVPNHTAVAWLERRLYSQIAKALKAVIGKDVDLQFIASEAGVSPCGSFGV